MIDIAKGRYWDEGIQLIDGCTPCSPGCDHCWSAAQHHRFNTYKNGWNPDRLTDIDGKFNGQIITNPERLSRFNTRKPKVFSIWNDLFHGAVPWEFQYKTYTVASNYPHNTILALTKRPENMVKVLKDVFFHLNRNGIYEYGHIWHGLTVCNQQEADEKIPIFLKVPGKRFLSIEPMLGEINISWPLDHPLRTAISLLDAVILGGETLGNRPGREMKIEWVDGIVDQCAAAGVPLFIKQLHLDGKVSKDISGWPNKLQRRELPWVKP